MSGPTSDFGNVRIAPARIEPWDLVSGELVILGRVAVHSRRALYLARYPGSEREAFVVTAEIDALGAPVRVLGATMFRSRAWRDLRAAIGSVEVAP